MEKNLNNFKFNRKSIKKYDLEKKWNDTTFAKKLANKAKKANLNDFERFRVMVLKKRVIFKALFIKILILN